MSWCAGAAVFRCSALITLTSARRITYEGGDCRVTHPREGRLQTVVVDDAERPWVCDGWSDEAMCRCVAGPSVNETSMVLRAEQDFYKALQQMRFLTDEKVSRKALQDLWWPKTTKQADSHLGHVAGMRPRDLFFMEGALQFSEVRNFSGVSVDQHNCLFFPNKNSHSGSDYREVDYTGLSVAGARTIIIEVWHDGWMSNIFLGEVGIPLREGKRHWMQERLCRSPYRSPEEYEQSQFNSATVSVTTDASFTPTACDESRRRRRRRRPGNCVEVKLKVSCLRAHWVNSVGYYGQSAEPYCKVRVKKDFSHPSVKERSLVARAGPYGHEWTVRDRPEMENCQTMGIYRDCQNVWEFAWQVPALPRGEPLILDMLSLRQQFQAYLAQLVRQTLLPKSEHGWCLGGGGSDDRVRKACRLLSFVELLHDTPVRRTYTACSNAQASSKAECQMLLMRSVIDDALDAPHGGPLDSALAGHLHRLQRQQWKQFQETGLVPESHFIVATMAMAALIAP